MASLHPFGPPMYLAFGFKFSPLWAIHPNHRSGNAIFVGCSDSAGINPKGGRSCVFRVCLVRGTCYMCLSTHLGRFVSESGNLKFAAYLGGYAGVNKVFGFSHGNEVRQLEFKSKAFELQSPEMEEIYDFRSGPLPGDLAEIEAFCRIQRLADQLHAVVMDSLCSMSSPNASVENAAISVQTSLSKRYVPMSSLEDKLVSELACIGTTLQQGRQEIFAAWDSSIVSAPAAPTPRLAHFRSKMRKCCDSFQNAVQCLLSVNRNRAVYESLQRLKTICLDAGYPRPEGAPRHEDIPNFAVVTRQQSALGKKDDIPYFWTGGQFTKQGLVWLLQNKLEIIVDLREEDVNDVLLDSALNKAVSSGKLRLIKLPIKIGTPPSVEQVREFSKILAENKDKTLYLHCQAGVRRTSTMISRWRDFVSRTDMTVTGQESAMTVFESVDKFSAHNNEPLDNNSFSVNEDVEEDAKDASFSCNDLAKIKDTTKPFDAQRPGPNVFSRKHMSQFFQRRKTIPASFSKGLKWRSMTYKTPVQSNIAGPAGQWLPVAGVQGSIVSNLNSQLNENPKSTEVDKDLKKGNIKKFGSKFEVPTSAISVSESASNQLDEETKTLINNNGAAREPKNEKHFASDNDVEGDMCTSRTGVVRLQSRKKAEMYLVRTDGFTCTREKVTESTLAFTHPSTQQQMLMWKTAPKTALLLKKLGDELTEEAKMVALFLHHKENINVMVEPEVHDRFARFPGFGFVQTFYNQDRSELHERVDFIVCLGGDGVILHASNLFRTAVPPVVSFNLGSLGFLTAHPFEDFKHDLHAIIHGNQHIEGIYITLRMRLRCEIFRNGMAIPGKVFEVLNEVVVDRGSNPYLCKIECYERNRLITKVQADGVLVATPTGSTAYSTAAGGSMVHPNVPCMLFTPICPHSLSFRPVILPDSALLELKVPNDSRSSAWVSFDGKKRQQLMKGDSIHIHMSGHPMPTVNRSDQTSDWFCSLVRCFSWNGRREQKALALAP